MAEWENAPLDPKKKKKQRVNLEPRRPMAARLKKTSGRLRTAPAYGRAVKKRNAHSSFHSHYSLKNAKRYKKEFKINALPKHLFYLED